MTGAPAPMRMLMVCMQFPTAPGQSYMTTELAHALAAAGHHVDVLHLDWAAGGDAVEERRLSSSIRLVRCPARKVRGLKGAAGHAAKFLLSGRRVDRIARDRFDLAGYDAAMMWMPALAVAPLARRLERLGVANRLLFIWDFFPDHHRVIGRVPPGLPFRVARRLEQDLLGTFTSILCTLPGNADYLRAHYRLRPGQAVLVAPIWADTSPGPLVDREAVRLRHGLPLDRPIAVFGGQIVEGRGFEQILTAADLGAGRGSSLVYLFVGDGRLAPLIDARAARAGNVIRRPALSREAYLELLGACDVGLVATVAGVASFSIPTKTIDYLRAGLPLVAALEPGNDFSALIERYGIGRAVPLEDAEQLHLAATALSRSGGPRFRERASRCLDELFDVRHAVASVEAACDAGLREPSQAHQARGGEIGARIAEHRPV